MTRQLPNVLFRWGVLSVLLVIIGCPIVFFIWGSFWTTAPGLGGTATLRGYQELFSPQVYSTLGNTVAVAVSGTAIALVLGVGGVVVTTKTDIVGRRLIAPAFLVQYFLPSYILALSWQFYAGPKGPVNQVLLALPMFDAPPVDIFSVWGIALVSGSHYAGIVYLLTKGAIESVPASLEEAAEISGAGLLTTLRKITLPLASPSLLIATVIVFTRLLQSFGTPLILGIRGGVFVLATQMYLALRGYPYDFTFAAALGMILLLIAVFGVAAQRRLSGAREKYETIAGQGNVTTAEYDLGRYGHVLSAVFLALIVFLYLLPVVTLVASSFQQTFLGFDLEHVEWTLENYLHFFVGSSAETFRLALKNTLLLSGVGGVVGMVLAALVSYIVIKTESVVGDVLDFLTFVPIVIPGLVLSTAYLWFFLNFNVFGLYGTIWLVMIAFTAKFIVYGVRASNSSFRSIGQELEDAANIAGAGLFGTFKRVFIPLLKPGLVSGYLLLFIDYMKSLSIPLLLGAGNAEVIQVLMWRRIANGNAEQSAAIATIIVALILVVYVGTYLLTDVAVTDI